MTRIPDQCLESGCQNPGGLRLLCEEHAPMFDEPVASTTLKPQISAIAKGFSVPQRTTPVEMIIRKGP